MAQNTIVVTKYAGCAQAARRLLVKKIRHRLTRQVAKCPKLRANCANCKQTAPITSHLGYRKTTQFCQCIDALVSRTYSTTIESLGGTYCLPYYPLLLFPSRLRTSLIYIS